MIIKSIHGLVAYFFLISTVLFVIASFIGFFKKSEFKKANMTLARLSFISCHTQLVLGFLLWYTQGYLTLMSENMKAVMSDKSIRLLAVEHPAINILGIAILTIGFISIKKSALDQTKHIKGILYFGIALILILSRIPYKSWLNL
ncbi:MAG: hypothetical protein ACK5UE_06760 [Chitinophagales bacterium]|jgi:hypothetical protein|nr:hypothetical protein [Sphingobacteriales bacterium]